MLRLVDELFMSKLGANKLSIWPVLQPLTFLECLHFPLFIVIPLRSLIDPEHRPFDLRPGHCVSGLHSVGPWSNQLLRSLAKER